MLTYADVCESEREEWFTSNLYIYVGNEERGERERERERERDHFAMTKELRYWCMNDQRGLTW
jgi:hypothetical protein